MKKIRCFSSLHAGVVSSSCFLVRSHIVPLIDVSVFQVVTNPTSLTTWPAICWCAKFHENNVTSYIRHPAIFSAQDLACLVFLRRSRWPFTARGRYALAATSYGSRNPMVGRTGSGRECGECRWIMLNHYVFIVFSCTIVAFLLFSVGFFIAILYPLSWKQGGLLWW